jgi:hypothetical protein
MERLINLGKIMVYPYTVKNLKEYEVKDEVKRLGNKWRICTYEELQYIWNTGWKLGLIDLMVFDEKDMYRINDEKYIAIYIDTYDNSLNFFNIPYDFESDSVSFNYLFVKDI